MKTYLILIAEFFAFLAFIVMVYVFIMLLGVYFNLS